MKTKVSFVGTLPYYSGTLTSITCSTALPSFLINGLYTPQHYDQLPGLFGIEAIIASDRSNITLHIDGSAQAHNVTIECKNIIDAITGQSQPIFQVTLLFAGKFIKYCVTIHQSLISYLYYQVLFQHRTM